MIEPEDVLTTWFPADDAAAQKLWWGKDEATDASLRERYGETLAQARAGRLASWTATPRGRLALVIVIDQLSRNIHRGSAEMFAADAQARALVREGLALGHDRMLQPIERVFFYLPLEHSESLADQHDCVALFEALAADVAPEQRSRFEFYTSFAVKHRDIVARFGRFPHRNALLGRTSSDEELAFLQTPGSSF